MLIAAILLLVAALACVAAELFVPSHGLLALCAAVLAVVAIAVGYRAHPLFGIGVAIVLIVSAPAVFAYAIRIYPRTPVGRRVMLATPPAQVRDPFGEESRRLSQLVGRQARTVTPLRLAGTIEIDGERIDAVSEAEVIPANTAVEVMRVTGLKVVVKPVAS